MSPLPPYRQKFDSDSAIAVLSKQMDQLEKRVDDHDEATGRLTAEIGGLRVELAKLNGMLTPILERWNARKSVSPDSNDSGSQLRLAGILAGAFGVIEILAEVVKALVVHH